MEPSAAIQELKTMRDKNPDRKGDTLLDLEKRDFDNYEHLLSFTHEEPFRRLRDAMHWVGLAQSKALASLGVNLNAILLEECAKNPRLTVTSKEAMDRLAVLADKKLREFGIVVETRRYEVKDDQWKDGIYILKQGEIAFYIGLPERAIIETVSKRWALRSNVRLEDDRKIIHFLN